jgi:hypothetical protein
MNGKKPVTLQIRAILRILIGCTYFTPLSCFIVQDQPRVRGLRVCRDNLAIKVGTIMQNEKNIVLSTSFQCLYVRLQVGQALT